VFWYTAMIATPLLLGWGSLKITAACGGAVLTTAMTWLWL